MKFMLSDWSNDNGRFLNFEVLDFRCGGEAAGPLHIVNGYGIFEGNSSLKDRGRMFLCNVGKFLPNCTVS